MAQQKRDKKTKNYNSYYQKVRRQIVKLLKEKGTYSKQIDDHVVDRLVYQMQMVDDAEKSLNINGMVMDTHSGYRQQNPEISIINNANKQILSYLKTLGLTMQDRYDLEAIAQGGASSLNEQDDQQTNTQRPSITDKYKK